MNITANAINKISEILSDEDMPEDAALRIYICGGGCSGFQYGFKIEEVMNIEDIIIEQNDVRILIDPMSMMYLEEATLNFRSELQGEMFEFNNPAAVTTCGCGSSFSV